MKTFKDTLKSRKYICLVYDDPSQKLLTEWALDNSFDLTKKSGKPFVFHTTIFYTTNEVYLRNRTIPQTPSEVIIDSIGFLGKNNEVPVLKLAMQGIVKYTRLEYEEKGLEDEWPNFSPHISLSYSENIPDLTKLEIPTFRPNVNKIVIEDLEDE